MSNTPDPTLPDPAAGTLVEPASVTMQRVIANAEVAMTPCPGCDVLPRPIVWHGDGRTTFELEHKPGCPEDPTQQQDVSPAMRQDLAAVLERQNRNGNGPESQR